MPTAPSKRTTPKKKAAKKTEAPLRPEGLADQSLAPTPVSEWKKAEPTYVPRREDGFIAELPSGNRVLMARTLDLPFLLRTGQIPNPLAGIVQTMIDSRSTAFPTEGLDSETLMQLLDLMHETVVRAVIEPPFDMPERRRRKGKNKETAEEYMQRLEEWEAKPDHISVWDMEMEDRFFIFAVAQGAAADLASFREEQERTLADLQASQGVRVPSGATGGSESGGSE